jgi:trk system potassium uptake protein TrkA
MDKSFAVIGVGRFGSSVALSLMESGAEVLIVDNNAERVNDLADRVTCAITADVSDPEAMKNLGLSNMDAVVVAMAQELEASIMSVMLAKEQGVPVVIAKARNTRMGDILQRVGADRIVYPEFESGIRTAKKLISSDFLEFFDLSENISLVEMLPKPSWVGHTLKELNLRRKYNVNVIAIKSNQEIVETVNPDEPLKAENPILVTVDKKNLKKLL